MAEYRYFRVPLSTGDVYYRVEETAPPGAQVQELIDGWWTPSAVALTAAAFVAETSPTEVSFHDIPCVFCAVVADEVTRTVVVDWPDALAILPRVASSDCRGPSHRGHLLVIPKAHVVDAAADPLITAMIAGRAAQLGARMFGTNFHLNMNCGEAAGQTVPHLHLHIKQRLKGDGVVMWWTLPDGYLVGVPGNPPAVAADSAVHALRKDGEAELVRRGSDTTLYRLYQVGERTLP